MPAAVPGIAFLSGGQSELQATERLNELHIFSGNKMPWTITFSFGRALQDTVLETWRGKDENKIIAQKMLNHRAMCNRLANMGYFNSDTEQF